MRRRSLLVLSAGLLALTGAATWRAVSVRDALFDRVERRLAGTAELTRESVALWLRERRTGALVVAERGTEPGAHTEVRLRSGSPAHDEHPLGTRTSRTAAERAAADSASRDRDVHLAGPFQDGGGSAAARDTITVSFAVAVPIAGEGPSRAAAPNVLVLRRDVARDLLPLVARRAPHSSEIGRLLARDGNEIVVISPAPRGDGYTFARWPLTALPAALRPGAHGWMRSVSSPRTARFRTPDGRAVLAGLEPVPGAPWAVLRAVDADEIAPHAAAQLRTELLLLLAAFASVTLAVVAARRAERGRRLRETAAGEARLAAAMRASFDAVIAVDERERVTLCNAAAERLLRCRSDEVIGRTVGVLMAPSVRDAALAKFRAFLASDEGAAVFPACPDLVIQTRDGGLRRVELSVAKGEAEGHRLCTLAIRDVTEREAAAEALRASEASARAFVENSPYGICRVTPDGRFTSVNPALATILGYDATDDLLRVDLGQLYADPAARAALIRRHGEGEAVVDGIETGWRRRDGRVVPVRLHSREVRDPRGRIAYYEAFVEDVAALHAAEQALRQAEKLAAVGQFVSGVAHELNNPLSAILLFADELLDAHAIGHGALLPASATASATATADGLEVLSLMREQALRARGIVRALLAFVRSTDEARDHVPARAVLDRAARALAPQVTASGGRLDVAFDGELGWLLADAVGIEQIVTNLVVNAAQAAPGKTVHLHASADHDARQLRVTVDDDGPGFSPEALQRVFEPFYTTKPVGTGTGLGLSVSLGIAERHGGTLLAANRGTTGGARVTLVLPLAARGACESTSTSSAPGVSHPTVAAGGESWTAEPTFPATVDGRVPRVLIVDDELAVCTALERLFLRRGWSVDVVSDGRLALARLLEANGVGAPYDVVLSDLRMPGVSGIALHDWIARTHPELLGRFVFATGDVASPESSDFVRRTACAVLEKPFELSALDAATRAVIMRERGPHAGDIAPSSVSDAAMAGVG